MKWLVYLYPKKWRNHYEEEFIYILKKRELSFKELIDILLNALEAQYLNLLEVSINMGNKIHEFMSKSIINRLLVIVSTIIIGWAVGYVVAKNTPSLLDLSPNSVLFIGVGLGFFAGYIWGISRGIIRAIKIAQKKDVFLNGGKLKFESLQK